MKLESIYEVAIEQHKRWSNQKPLTQEEATEIQKKRLDSFRLALEPHIYHYLIEKYGEKLSAIWQTYTPPKNSQKAVVIVERRPHPNFWFILRNIAWAAPDLAVYIFCSDENINFVKSLVGDKLPYFNIVEAFQGNASRERGKKEVDNLLSNYKFYEFLNAEYIITAEMDTFFRRKIPDSMFEGTYWGNPWPWVPATPGGGGVTIRNVKKLAAHCKKIRPDTSKDLITAQDAWLSDTTYEEKEEFPDIRFRANHIMECLPTPNPVAVHQFWTYLDSYNISEKKQFIANLNRILTFDL